MTLHGWELVCAVGFWLTQEGHPVIKILLHYFSLTLWGSPFYTWVVLIGVGYCEYSAVTVFGKMALDFSQKLSISLSTRIIICLSNNKMMQVKSW